MPVTRQFQAKALQDLAGKGFAEPSLRSAVFQIVGSLPDVGVDLIDDDPQRNIRVEACTTRFKNRYRDGASLRVRLPAGDRYDEQHRLALAVLNSEGEAGRSRLATLGLAALILPVPEIGV